jgi:hypothetical protein
VLEVVVGGVQVEGCEKTKKKKMMMMMLYQMVPRGLEVNYQVRVVHPVIVSAAGEKEKEE